MGGGGCGSVDDWLLSKDTRRVLKDFEGNPCPAVAVATQVVGDPPEVGLVVAGDMRDGVKATVVVQEHKCHWPDDRAGCSCPRKAVARSAVSQPRRQSRTSEK